MIRDRMNEDRPWSVIEDDLFIAQAKALNPDNQERLYRFIDDIIEFVGVDPYKGEVVQRGRTKTVRIAESNRAYSPDMPRVVVFYTIGETSVRLLSIRKDYTPHEQQDA